MNFCQEYCGVYKKKTFEHQLNEILLLICYFKENDPIFYSTFDYGHQINQMSITTPTHYSYLLVRYFEKQCLLVLLQYSIF